MAKLRCKHLRFRPVLRIGKVEKPRKTGYHGQRFRCGGVPAGWCMSDRYLLRTLSRVLLEPRLISTKAADHSLRGFGVWSRLRLRAGSQLCLPVACWLSLLFASAAFPQKVSPPKGVPVSTKKDSTVRTKSDSESPTGAPSSASTGWMYKTGPYNDFGSWNNFVLPGYDTRQLSNLFGLELKDIPIETSREEPADASEPPIPKDQVVGVKILTDAEPQDHSTKICWYFDGAVVTLPIPEKDVHQGEHYRIHHLSTAVDERSIVVKGPESAMVHAYYLKADSPADSSQTRPTGRDPKEVQRETSLSSTTDSASASSESSFVPSSQYLELTVSEPISVDDNAEWLLQYNVCHVSWSASHIVELTKDRQHISFSTFFHVQNLSGIPFQQARVWFIDKNLPQVGGESTNHTTPAYAYRYPFPLDLGPQQRKVIVWNSAKRIAVRSSNGLFVGGTYLGKMEQKAFPQVENWITFKNTKAEGLGLPLPGGLVSVYSARNGFATLGGYTRMNSARNGEEVTMSMPSFVHRHGSKKKDEDEGILEATLVQESYRVLTPTVVETEYRLILKNSQSEATVLTVTLDMSSKVTYQVLRANISHERNERGEAVWTITVPPRGNREVRYKLALRQRT